MNNGTPHILQKHFDKAVELIQHFDGKEQLQFYLKKYFSDNKKHGSKDRKNITHFCYTFFRIGGNLSKHPVEEKLKVALFLCETSLVKLKEIFPKIWGIHHAPDVKERISFIQHIYPEFSLGNIFSYEYALPQNIDRPAFQQSFLIQPKVFLRIRKGKNSIVSDKLNKAHISFETISENSLSVAQNIHLDTVLKLNEEAVIQDLSSQKVGAFLALADSFNSANRTIRLWDCCAASGGKSILAKDFLYKIDLTVSDVRPQILQNLKYRFREANIHSYKSFVADLSNPVSLKEKFDLIICDAPCSGSGTWSRTPEMLSAFDVQQIEKFQSLQKSIVSNAITHLYEKGFFLYITCSVFTKENEEMVQFVEQELGMKCIKSENIFGYTQRADSMFAALFSFGK